MAAQQRPKLRQTSSVADLKSSFTRLRGRFGSKDKQDIWGTAEEQGVDDEDDEFVQHADAIDVSRCMRVGLHLRLTIGHFSEPARVCCTSAT